MPALKTPLFCLSLVLGGLSCQLVQAQAPDGIYFDPFNQRRRVHHRNHRGKRFQLADDVLKGRLGDAGEDDLDFVDLTGRSIVVYGQQEVVKDLTNALLDKGVFTVMSIAPAVPPGKDLIRTAVSALHSDEDLEKIAAAMAYAVKQM